MTYSIVARDASTGQIGVAVQSHYFSTGSVVTWAEPGVGAVATQSMARIEYGPEGLALMRDGVHAAEALARLAAADRGESVRQVAMIDAAGRVATHTGARCIAAAGHITGDGFSVQANMMTDDTIWPAMAAAYTTATGSLAERMLAALAAGQDAGGDIRGQQSAAMIVVSGDRSEPPWKRELELRIEDHAAPIDELRRLLRLHRAYRVNSAGDDALGAGDLATALARYEEARALAPESHELRFWAALALLRSGHEDQALPMLRETFAGAPGFADLVPRLTHLGMVADDPALLARISALR